jgi:hypothetical protein
MDPATMTYLINSRKKIQYVTPKQEYDPAYKKRILELTESMFENNINNDIYLSFETYISDCMKYFKKIEEYENEEKPQEIAPIHGDEYIFAPKKINVLVKQKQKNIFLIHDKNRA